MNNKQQSIELEKLAKLVRSESRNLAKVLFSLSILVLDKDDLPLRLLAEHAKELVKAGDPESANNFKPAL